ncbi:MAG TPA: CNNM domain-containing protein, partial [Longimicrobiales bacterium]
MDPSSILFKIAMVVVLVGINAYFVATEFALVAVRRTRIEQRLRGGDKRARYVSDALDHPDDFISAAQLGITVASIAIGYIAEDTIHVLILPYLQAIHLDVPFFNASLTGHIISTIITLMMVTYLHVVLGEQVPKMIAIQKAEPIALWTTRPTQIVGIIFRP